MDSISHEYQKRHQTRPKSTEPENKQQSTSQSNLDQERFQFFEKHSKTLKSKNLIENNLSSSSSSLLDSFRVEWTRFSHNKNQPIKTCLDIVWPPFFQETTCSNDQIMAALDLVQHSVAILRWFQINWHPDRFFNRFGSRFKTNEQTKNQIMTRVNSVSQILNRALDQLRNNNNTM